MDEVFRALADPTRRSLLDELYRGRPDAERARGATADEPLRVMKHLRVLEQAGLVISRRRGREKLHFLNAVPIRLVHDRWVSKYASRGLRRSAASNRHSRGKHGEGFEIYIKTTPERLWQALTDGEMRGAYTFAEHGVRLDSGSAYRGVHPNFRARSSTRESRGRGAPPASPEPPRTLERRRRERGTSRVTTRSSGGRLLPADRHPRPAAHRREPRDLWRLPISSRASRRCSRPARR